MPTYEQLQALGKRLTEKIEAAQAEGDQRRVDRLLRNKDEVNRQMAELVEVEEKC